MEASRLLELAKEKEAAANKSLLEAAQIAQETKDNAEKKKHNDNTEMDNAEKQRQKEHSLSKAAEVHRQKET